MDAVKFNVRGRVAVLEGTIVTYRGTTAYADELERIAEAEDLLREYEKRGINRSDVLALSRAVERHS